MKKLILILIILSILSGIIIFTLNFFDIISVRAWGEKAILNNPFLEEYVATNQELQELDSEYQQLSFTITDINDLNNMLEEEITILQTRLEAKEEQIRVLKQDLQILEDEERTRAERKEKLISIYSEMAPFEAAPIIENMDRELALLILRNLRNDNTAAILTNLDPQTAAQLSKELELAD